MMAPSGWLILDKPVGIGSTQAVGAVKRVLREAGYGKVRVGHGGTLDPLASGVLPIALGEATKLTARMLNADKVYEFTVQFGRETDTLDLEGRVVATSDHQPGFGALELMLERDFTGPIDQVPPAYSAIRIDGARAYDRARSGDTVDMPTRRITVHRWEYLAEGFVGEWDNSEQDNGEQYATLRAHVSKGTYIRALARDIALALGTRGHVTRLRRLKAGPFGLSGAISLDSLNEIGKSARLEDHLLSLEAGLDGIPAFHLSPDQAEAASQGRMLIGLPQPDGLYAALFRNRLLALLRIECGEGRVERGFNQTDAAE